MNINVYRLEKFDLGNIDEYQIKQISNIATDLIGNKVVFFVGSGFSRDLGYPGWGELLKEIISDNNLMEKIKSSSLFYLISERDHSDYEEINRLLLDNLIGVDFLRLAGYVDILLKENGKQDIQSEIKKKIMQYEDERVHNIKRYDYYRSALGELNNYISEIITTNYDTNLEYCIDNISVIHRNLDSINNKKTNNLKQNIKLYKIHGCISDNDNGIIITEKDYQEFNSSNKYIFNKLYSTFMENNIVFIGYSLTDPNIRSLLSEVIDEMKRNQLEKKKIYWNNRGNINEIDRKFYESIYSMQIIDKIEILEFLKRLVILKNSKWIDLEKVEKEWLDIANELSSTSPMDEIEYTNLINKVVEAEKIEQVLLQIYNNFVISDGARKEADRAFFTLLSKADTSLIGSFESKVTDMLAIEDNHLLAVIDLLKNEVAVKDLFVKKKYSKKLLESLLSRANTINDFYLYKSYTIALLDYYEIFSGELWGLKGEFVKVFTGNYQYLTNTRTLGYSWESLQDVEEKLKVLADDIVEEIIMRYPNATKSKIQKEQILALTSTLKKVKRNRLNFIHIIKPRYAERIEIVITKELESTLVKTQKFEMDYERIDDKWVDIYTKDSSIVIVEPTTTNEEEIIQIKFDEKELIIKFYADYNKEEFYLNIGEVSLVNPEIGELKNSLNENINQILSEWNLIDDND